MKLTLMEENRFEKKTYSPARIVGAPAQGVGAPARIVRALARGVGAPARIVRAPARGPAASARGACASAMGLKHPDRNKKSNIRRKKMPTDEEKKDTTTNDDEKEVKPRRRSNSFSDLLKKGTNMASGISTHLEALTPRGINEETVQLFTKLVEDSSKLDNDQEILKGQLKEKTASLRKNTKELRELLSQCTLIIKAVIPQERWVDFGISAKK
jgi:hypothetical protein